MRVYIIIVIDQMQFKLGNKIFYFKQRTLKIQDNIYNISIDNYSYACHVSNYDQRRNDLIPFALEN